MSLLYATQDNKVKALTDMTVFASLIGYHGGWEKFGTVHNKLAGFVTTPQKAKLCLSGKRYNNRRLILMPRGHLKSTVCSVLYTLWRIYRNPNIRILVGCNKLELSQAFVRELRQYLEDPELQSRVWNSRPHVSGRLVPLMDAAGRKRRSKKGDDDETETEDKKLIWSLSAIQVLRSEVYKEPTVLATSVGTRVTGQHYDLLILDDIVDFDNCSSPAKIDKVFEWAQDMESVIDPVREYVLGKAGAVEFREKVGDEVVILGTRYDGEDYYHYILERLRELEYRVFVRNIFRNGVDAAGGYIWSEKFNEEYIRRLRSRTTPRRWASQYLNSILATEENILQPDKLKYFKTTKAELKPETGLVEIQLPNEVVKRIVKPVLVVDSAVSQTTKADNTVLTVGGVDENRDVFVLDTRVGKFTPSETINHIFELCDKWKLFSVSVETNGVGATLPYGIKERFRTERPLIVREIRSVGNKKQRIEQRLQPLLENGKLYLTDWIASHQGIQNEFLYFPRLTAKDDFLDTVDMLCEVANPTSRRGSKNAHVSRHRTYNSKYGGTR